MDLLVLCPHFTPDTAPTGTVMTAIARGLVERGHRLHVVTSLPWYTGHAVEAEWRGRMWRTETTEWGRITRVHPFPTDKRNIRARAAGFAGFVGLASVLFSAVLGVSLGLASGYLGGRLDAFIMRVADIQLSFPAILIALLIDGIARIALPREAHDALALYVLVVAIGLSKWVDYARTVRGSTLVEKGKDYVQAARVIGRRPLAIMVHHVLPNAMGPVLVIATINVATAIITEATLSFLGVGVPPTQPSLGTLIRVGNDFLISGEWWISVFPGAALVLLVLAVNLLGDWLRDALNPKLR